MINSLRRSDVQTGFIGEQNYDGSNFYSNGLTPNSNFGNGQIILTDNQFYIPSHVEKPFSVINTEPISVAKDRPIVLIDPILETHVKSYLTWSLINVFFCCCFGGIITTILSCNVMRLNDDKNYKEAYKLSRYVIIGNMVASAIGSLLFIILFPYIYMAIYPYLPKINY